jgi:ABC-type multidrug transport system ATPase subunit
MVAQLGGVIDRIGLLHRGQLLDEGPLGDVETRLALNGRYTVAGTGEVDLEESLKGIEVDRIEHESDENGWSLTFRGESQEVLQALLSNGVALSSWAPVAPNLVEWLCAATGMDVQDISLEVASSAMLPMRTVEVGEDE